MNIIDSIVLGGVIIGFFFGIIGRATKKICSLIFTIVAILVAYFACGTVVNAIMGISVGADQTLKGYLVNMLSELTAEFSIPTDTIVGLVEGIIKLLAFYILAFALNVVINLIGKIVVSIVLKIKIRAKVLAGQPVKRFTALKTFGIFGAIKWGLLAFLMVLPITVIAPIVPDLAKSVGENETLTTLSEQIENSGIIKFSDGIYSSTRLNFMVYNDGEKDCYLYDDIKSIKGFLKMASIFMPADGEEADPIKLLSNMSDEEIREMLTDINSSDSTKEILNSVAGELDVDIDFTEVDLSKEADTVIAIKNIIDVSGEDVTIKDDISEEHVEVLTDALASSDIIEIVAKNNEGMLADVDNTTKNTIEDILKDKVANNVISQEKMDLLMGLFG